ncbi:hypothetical protein GCM10028784_05530 [Myceligenerans cantabricum]
MDNSGPRLACRPQDGEITATRAGLRVPELSTGILATEESLLVAADFPARRTGGRVGRVPQMVRPPGVWSPHHSSEASMKAVLIVLGAVLATMGSVFTLQGLGYLPGSVMTGVTLWAIIGPIVVVAGVVLIVRGARTGRSGRP